MDRVYPSFSDYDFSNVGDHLNAKQWNEAMDRGAILVDMRNHYESEIGKFVGAICPQTETFKEELPIVKDILKGKETEEILLYCTGGIRCEKASAYLNHHGFKNVNQLHGGIIDYANQLKKDVRFLLTMFTEESLYIFLTPPRIYPELSLSINLSLCATEICYLFSAIIVEKFIRIVVQMNVQQ